MRLVFLGAVFSFCIASCVFAAEQKAQMPFTPGPQILQIIGETDAYLAPARYPKFYQYESDNPACGDYLKNELSLSPICTISKYGKGPAAGACQGFVPVPDLLKNDFVIPPSYRKTSNLLIAWTVRVEGYKVGPYIIWPSLCSMWHGTSYQSFPGGDLRTRLYINGVQKCQDAIMTLPDSGVTATFQPSDPTHTGSCLITPQDFGGEFPEKINIEIRWQNDTCMQIKSPAKMRNLIITAMPIGKIKQ